MTSRLRAPALGTEEVARIGKFIDGVKAADAQLKVADAQLTQVAARLLQ
jgi:hypothetical protein